MATPTYSARDFDMLAPHERDHFWFRSRRAVIANLVAAAGCGGGAILDIGCGTGEMLPALVKACPGALVVGVDLFREGLAIAATRTAQPLVQCDLEALPFSQCFDIACLLDVIEHLDDDVSALRAASQTLRPAGRLLVTVPAFQWLWSQVDEEAHHRRRYDRRTLLSRLNQAGLTVDWISYFMSPAVLPLFVKRRLLGAAPSPAGVSEQRLAVELRIDRRVNGVAFGLLGFERWLLRHRGRMPFGSSLVAVARPA